MPRGLAGCHRAAPAEFDEAWAAVLMDDVHPYTACSSKRRSTGLSMPRPCQRAVLAAATLPPADLKLRDDLRTRLGWGHVFQLRAE